VFNEGFNGGVHYRASMEGFTGKCNEGFNEGFHWRSSIKSFNKGFQGLAASMRASGSFTGRLQCGLRQGLHWVWSTRVSLGVVKKGFTADFNETGDFRYQLTESRGLRKIILAAAGKKGK